MYYLINAMDEIIPHLYISNWNKSNDIYELKKNNIKAIITIETHFKSNDIMDYYRNNNIDYYYLYLNDLSTENIYDYFDDSYNFIKNHILKGNNVLIHCRAGVSRSATLVLNYIIKELYYSNSENIYSPEFIVNYALEIVRDKRPIINPNEGFIKQLLIKAEEYYNEIIIKYKNSNIK